MKLFALVLITASLWLNSCQDPEMPSAPENKEKDNYTIIDLRNEPYVYEQEKNFVNVLTPEQANEVAKMTLDGNGGTVERSKINDIDVWVVTITYPGNKIIKVYITVQDGLILKITGNTDPDDTNLSDSRFIKLNLVMNIILENLKDYDVEYMDSWTLKFDKRHAWIYDITIKTKNNGYMRVKIKAKDGKVVHFCEDKYKSRKKSKNDD